MTDEKNCRGCGIRLRDTTRTGLGKCLGGVPHTFLNTPGEPYPLQVMTPIAESLTISPLMRRIRGCLFEIKQAMRAADPEDETFRDSAADCLDMLLENEAEVDALLKVLGA